MNRLQCWPWLQPLWERAGVDYYPYQVATAERVVNEMGGQAILADEVGLGKTIEAGLVITELFSRGLASQALVLAPASLVFQWEEEMREKFGLAFVVNPRGPEWLRHPLIIASLDTAKREGSREWLLRRSFDILVVDEAHKLKNHQTRNYGLVRDLHKHYLLLLSATPLQNDLNELYNLVNLVRPDLFGSYRIFSRQFMIDKRTPKNPEQLKESLSRVMIRNRRRDMEIYFPRRHVSMIPLQLSPDEASLYRSVTETVRQEYRRRLDRKANILPLLTLQREVCSSSFALRETLGRMETGWMGERLQHLFQLAWSIRDNRKAQVVEDLLPRIAGKTIIFTEFRATQEYLARRFMERGFSVILFHGGLSPREKAQAIENFRKGHQVLVSTECGGQGLNLQFCHHIINYDLPWNPMRVEQRIGRVHRLGQTADVHIYNLYAQNTIEEHILWLLHAKIDLFRQVIGELDLILRHLEREKSIESRILEIAMSARDKDEMAQRFNHLGDQILSLRRQILRQESLAP